MKKIQVLLLLTVWLGLTVFAWFGPSQPFSDAERRPLAQMPELSADSVLSGSFMTDFEDYTLDQFPLRNSFRTIKSLFHTYILGQKDNNGIYLSQGYAAKQEYPLREDSVAHALDRFQKLYDNYLTDSKVFMAIVPDKGYYLSQESGNLALDYDKMYAEFAQGMPWATQIDLRQVLSIEDYYRTDTHWRQEKLLEAAGILCQNLGVSAPKAEEFTATALSRPFYGVYYGQAALPMEPDTLYLMESDWLRECSVYDHESGQTVAVYDEGKLDSRDLYDVFLSGSRSLLTITNPAGQSGKELVIFRDSFGSAITPLLLKDYETVTVIDIRYIQIDLLSRFIDFHGQDALFLYSTLVLNNSETIK